jgi:hypothetical protein
MPLHEVRAIHADPGELGVRKSATKVGDDRILNGGITQIGAGIRRQQCNPGDWTYISAVEFRGHPFLGHVLLIVALRNFTVVFSVC